MVACIIAQAALLRSAVRTTAAMAPDSDAKRPPRRTELAWAIVPALVLAIVLAFTWRKLHESSAHRHAPVAGAPVISS